MPLFRYQAFNQKGVLVSGTRESTSASELKELLKNENLLVFKIAKENTSSGGSLFSFLFETGIDDKTKVQFTSQLSVLLKASVPLVDAMELLSQQFTGTIKQTLSKIIDDLKEGSPLADSLEKHPKAFDNIYIQLVRAGEASGKLEVVLDRLTKFLERSIEIESSVRSALRGPLINLFVAVSALIGATVFVLPIMAGTLAQTGNELPLITTLLLSFSDLLKNYWAVFSIAAFLVYLAFFKWKNSEKGKIYYNAILLKIPKLGTLIKTKAVVQFSQTLGMLLDAGVNLPVALDIVNNVIDNPILVSELKIAREEIIKEGKIAKHLKNTGMFPPVSIYMMKTGEESGKLSEMLIKTGNDMETELIEAIDGFISTINPIMTVVLGSFALVFALAILLPMLKLSDVGAGNNF